MKKIITFVFLLSTYLLFANTVIFNHTKPNYISNNLSLSVTIQSGYTNISSLSLMYKTNHTIYTELVLDDGYETNPVFTANLNLPSSTTSLEYYFVAKLKNGSTSYYPSNAVSGNTFKIISNDNYNNGNISILSPIDKTIALNEDLIFVASMFDIGENNFDEFKLFVNNKDVSKKAKKAGLMIVYKISKPKSGSYNFNLKIFNKKQLIAQKKFISKVSSKKAFKLPLNIIGSSSIETRLKSTSADDFSAVNNKQYGTALYKLSFSGYKNWLKFSTNLSLSSRESKNMQAVNRYRFKFYAPHFNLFLGDYSPYFGSYSLSSKNINGYFAKLYFKYFNLQITQGQTKRAVNGKITNNILQKNGTFAQDIYGIKTVFGNSNRFVFGLSVVKTKDDLSSIDKKYYIKTENDTINYDVVKAQDNFVTASDFYLKLFNQKLKIGGEIAMSMHNNNINSGIMSDEELKDMGINVDDLPAKPKDIKDIIVVNKNIEPIIPGIHSAAFKVYSEFKLPYLYTGVSYSQVGSAFNALSALTNQKDTQTINFNNSLILMQNRLNIGFGFNFMQDNLSSQKSATSKTTAMYYNILYKPSGLPLTLKTGFNNSNLTSDVKNTNSVRSLNGQEISYKYKQANVNYNVGADYLYKNYQLAPTKFSFDFSQNISKDEQNNSFDNNSKIIALSATTNYENMPLTTLVKYSFTLDEQNNFDDETKANYNSVLAKADFDLFNNTLKPFISYSLTSFTGDIDTQKTSFLNVGSSYSFFKNTQVSTRFGLKTYSNSDENDVNYQRFEWVFKVSKRF